MQVEQDSGGAPTGLKNVYNEFKELKKSLFLIDFKYHCTEVRNGQFSSGGGILSQLQWYQSDIQKLGFPKYEIKDN